MVGIERRSLGIGFLKLFDPFLGLIQNLVPLSEHQGFGRARLHASRDPVVCDAVQTHGALEEHLGILGSWRGIL